MDGDFLNSFAETFEISSLLSDLTETDSESGENISAPALSELHESTVSQLFSTQVNWRNTPQPYQEVPTKDVTNFLSVEDIPEKSMSELFQSINWTNIQPEEEAPLEVEESFTVDAMFDGFNW